LSTQASVLAITGPIYLLVATGWAATRLGLFSRNDMRLFGKYVLSLGLPALLFHALSQRRIEEVFHPGFIAAYALGSLLLMGLGLWWARRVARQSLSASAVLTMGMVCSNSGFIGFPLVSQLYGPSTAGVALALAMLVENVLLIPLLLAIADSDVGGAAPGGRAARLRMAFAQSMRGLARNPLVHAIGLGLLFSIFQWRLPSPVAVAVNLVAASTPAISLLVIGGSVAGIGLGGMLREIGAVAVAKLLLHPLAVLLVVLMLPPMPRELQVAVVLMAAVPMFGSYPILAQKHGHDTTAAAAQLLTTAAGFVTLTVLLAWIGGSSP
jgi:malonate transporter and related proteins